MNNNKIIKGYKMTNNDMTCNEFKYDIGKEYIYDGDIKICNNGYHFCTDLIDCLYYYDNIKGDKRFFEIEAYDTIEKEEEDSKCVTNHIKFIRELSIEDVYQYIRNNKDKVNWYFISIYQSLSEDFIREFKDKVNWVGISQCQSLSEDFIREFKDLVDWNCISYKQTLSEDFIREFKDKVNWYYISIKQSLSEDFIIEFADRVNWSNISIYQTLSE